MSLTKKSESKTVYLQAKHFCLWREIKAEVEGCETVITTNPKTNVTGPHYGYRFDSVQGHVFDVVKYDTDNKYPTRYFGYKLHLRDGNSTYVLDMPYKSRLLGRFLKIMPNINWSKPLSLDVFKAKKDNGEDETGIWFKQDGATVRSYFTKDDPHGMPPPEQDEVTMEWDYRDQNKWLAKYLETQIIPQIQEHAVPAGQSDEPETGDVDDSSDIPF